MPEDPRNKIQNPESAPKFSAVILAGNRQEVDPLLEAEQEPCKALIHLGERPMIDYVLKAVQRSGHIDDIYVCADPDIPFDEKTTLLKELKQKGLVKMVASQEGPAESLANALTYINKTKPVIALTADHPLLTRAILKEFMQKSLRAQCDASVGVIPTDIIENAYPKSKRTRIQFREGAYTGCNLFALMTERSRALPSYWEDIQHFRKTPMQMAKKFGGLLFVKYFLGLMTLNSGLSGISKKLNINIKPVRMHQPESGIDVDTTEDLALVRDILQNY